MKRMILCFILLVICWPALQGQNLSQETSSNLVNYNLNRINLVRSYLPHYTGKGLTASIKEFRYDTLDIDFTGRHLPHPDAAAQTSPHSTLMATVLAGGGNSFRTGLGVAWGAKLTSSSFLNIFPDENSYFQQLGVSVQNHSYGVDSIENYYGPIAAAYDLQLSRLPHLLHVFSIGNLGQETPAAGLYAGLAGYANMSGEFKLAKNILTMGVVDSFGLIDPRSSHGPAFDGRIKPELVAFGIDGTSPAAALASGTALLLQQAYHELEGELPPAALVKALLINGARDLGPAGPDHVYGFGNLDAFRSLQTLSSGRYLSDSLRFDETRSFLIEVPAGMRELKLTLAWTDPPASVGSAKALVNDLDLELIRLADQQVWLPQILSIFPHPDSLGRVARQGKDRLNNVEQIVLQDPLPGRYEIKVNAFEFGVSTQLFQLVYDWEEQQDFRWLFPAKKDILLPNRRFSEQLLWESGSPENQGSLSYSYDGRNWTVISPEVALSPGAASWFPPDTLARALLRMQIGQQYFISDTFTISGQPALSVLLNCADSIALSWPPVAGADHYRLYRLGAEYMEPLLDTPDTFVVIKKGGLLRPYLALAPVLTDGQEGLRSLAYNPDQQAVACYEQLFYGEVIAEAAHLSLRLSTAYGIEALVLERLIGGQFVARQEIAMPAGNMHEFTDVQLAAGVNTYRVKIVLQNGSTLYSSLVQLSYIEPDHFLLYPNPLSRQANLQVLYNVAERDSVTFQLFTALGGEVLSLTLGELENLLVAEDLQSGLYFYRFVRDGKLLQGGKLVVR